MMNWSKMRATRQKNMVMGPAGPRNKIECAGKSPQQFTRIMVKMFYIFGSLV
jgi:hypothetical protein